VNEIGRNVEGCDLIFANARAMLWVILLTGAFEAALAKAPGLSGPRCAAQLDIDMIMPPPLRGNGGPHRARDELAR
jgi:hypothetical protein